MKIKSVHIISGMLIITGGIMVAFDRMGYILPFILATILMYDDNE